MSTLRIGSQTRLAQAGATLSVLTTTRLITLGTLAYFAALTGIYWDITWHVVVGRDSFWIPPHVVVYAGVTVALLSGLGGLCLTWLRSHRVSPGFGVATLGPLLQVAAAPLDNLWHTRIGLDPTIWSAPHLMGMAGGIIGLCGLLTALAEHTPAPSALPLWRGRVTGGELLAVAALAALLTLAMLGLGELDFHLERRDTLLYPLLGGTFAAVVLVAASRYGRPGSATAVALTYMLFRSALLLIVWRMGMSSHLTPPVFALAPALAIDLAYWKLGAWRPLVAAVLAGPAFLLGEWLYRLPFDTTGWSALEVFASMTVVSLIVALGGLAGDRLGAAMRSGARH